MARRARTMLTSLSGARRAAGFIALSSIVLPLLRGLDPSRAPVAAGDAAIDFQRDVRPLLSDRCFLCHGPDAERRQADLRLDTKESATADRQGSRAVVPGDPAASALLARIESDDPDFRMPPPDSGRTPLSTREKELMRRWVASGAPYATHWAFEPPRRAALPDVRDAAWCRDPIDRFVRARLEAEGIAPSPEADLETLARRAALDLTGIPPEPEEIDTLLADAAPDAFDRFVDRLLASPRHAERMAADWLDLARYADTYGYQADVHRRVWPWRDWVIHAFDANLPWDEFLTWQLAGDLLPGATREQRLATAFNRLHRMTNEGGSVEEEFRVESVIDRVNTFGTAMLGLTVECARCHDHKYDPIPQEDYYGLFAFFDDIDESGLYSHFTSATPTPTLALPTEEQEAAIAAKRAAVARAEGALRDLAAERRGAFEAWLASEESRGAAMPGPAAHYPLDAIEDGKLANAVDATKPGTAAAGVALVEGHAGSALRFPGDDAAQFPGVAEFAHFDPFAFSFWMRTPSRKERAVVLRRSRAWTDAGSQGYQVLFEEGRLSWSLVHFWPGNAASIRTRAEIPAGRWVLVTVTHDGSGRAAGLRIDLDGAPAATEVVRDGLWKPITGGDPGALALGERFRDVGLEGGEVDDLRVFDRCLSPLESAELFAPSIAPAIDAARAGSDAAARDAVFAFWLGALDPAARERREVLREARRVLAATLAGVEEIMVMEELPEPRAAFVLERGRYDLPDRSRTVAAHTPSALPPMAEGLPRNRLGLARWLTDPAHPLAARVVVNRLWTIAFGRGLVETAEDFGSQGDVPAHRDLLDTLARDFVESGWDGKAMLRRLVGSATWRQSSRPRADLEERDPGNRLLARGPAKRLTAEMLRDQALHASGLLVEKRGGPSVKPWQPPGLWEIGWGGAYVPDEGEGAHRRSLYTYWRRTVPPPAMVLFDAAKREVCVARRPSTSTPLQVLVLLNDPQFVETARALAARELAPPGRSARERIAGLFRRLTGRRPGESESAALESLLAAQESELRAEPARADALLAVGSAPVPPGADRVAVAALAVVASTILASDAAVMAR